MSATEMDRLAAELNADTVKQQQVEIARLRAALAPFARAAVRGEEMSTMFRDAGLNAMECRGAFIYWAPRSLCVRDFITAREALAK